MAPQPFTRRRAIAFFAMVFGMFMAILDIQVVSASLSEIQAGLSASKDEVAWVQTSYLIAEVVMIPLSGLISRALSTRVLFTIACAGFTLSSVGCAFSTSIEEMIFWRVLQGFIGGGMIPTVFAAAFTVFPPEKRSVISPLIGMVATLAPTIGPTIGGYLTDLFSWHWLFLVNLPPGIIVSVVVWWLVDFDKPQPELLKNFDWVGLAAMAGFLGGMEYVLEEGASKGWFDDEVIVSWAVVSVISAAIFFWRATAAAVPIVDFHALKNRNFATGCLLSFILGSGLYGLTYVYPVYLSRVQGYSALMIGETLFISGAMMFISAPIVGRLSTKLDLRVMIGLGFIGFALGAFLASDLTKDWGFDQLLWPQILRGCSLMLCMVPINNLALGALPPQLMKGASGLFNLTRNLGGAVGLALINTLLNDRMDLHLSRLRDGVRWGREAAETTLTNMTTAMAPLGTDASQAALSQMAGMVRREALVQALSDVFLALAVVFVLMAGLAALMRKPRAAAPAGAGH